MLVGQGTSFFLQAAYFLLLAHLLGATEYGMFSGVNALVNVVASYSALGSGLLFMRYVTAKDSNAPVCWGNALATTLGMTAVITAVFIFLGPLITGVHSLALIVRLVIANCLFTQILDIATKVFRTYERMRLSAILTMLSNLSRFIASLVMWFTMGHATAVQWSAGVLIATGVTAVIAVLMVHSAIRKISFSFHLLARRIWEGLKYSISATSQAIYNDFDKTMLSHYGMNLQNGFYTLAYRIIDFSFTPIAAIDLAILPRYFSLSHLDIKLVGQLAFKAVSAAVCIGVVVALILWGVSPLVPHLVGRDFGSVKIAIRWLCLIPLLRGIHIVVGNSLTATGHQHLRLAAQFSVAALNLGLNLWLIPTHGWLGAAWSSLASDGALAVITAILVMIVMRRSEAPMDGANLVSPASAG